MKMKTVNTLQIDIHVGLREGYSNVIHHYEEVLDICQDYCDKVLLCVSVQKVDYIYTDGRDPGAKVTIINYPRFPTEYSELVDHAHKIANILLKRLGQNRVSIVTPEKTIMIENKTI